jgi:hypothetical protein
MLTGKQRAILLASAGFWMAMKGRWIGSSYGPPRNTRDTRKKKGATTEHTEHTEKEGLLFRVFGVFGGFMVLFLAETRGPSRSFLNPV